MRHQLGVARRAGATSTSQRDDEAALESAKFLIDRSERARATSGRARRAALRSRLRRLVARRAARARESAARSARRADRRARSANRRTPRAGRRRSAPPRSPRMKSSAVFTRTISATAVSAFGEPSGELRDQLARRMRRRQRLARRGHEREPLEMGLRHAIEVGDRPELHGELGDARCEPGIASVAQDRKDQRPHRRMRAQLGVRAVTAMIVAAIRGSRGSFAITRRRISVSCRRAVTARASSHGRSTGDRSGARPRASCACVSTNVPPSSGTGCSAIARLLAAATRSASDRRLVRSPRVDELRELRARSRRGQRAPQRLIGRRAHGAIIRQQRRRSRVWPENENSVTAKVTLFALRRCCVTSSRVQPWQEPQPRLLSSPRLPRRGSS